MLSCKRVSTLAIACEDERLVGGRLKRPHGKGKSRVEDIDESPQKEKVQHSVKKKKSGTW